MNYTIEAFHPIKNIQWALEKQLNKGFKYFVNLLMGNKAEPVATEDSTAKRNFFLQKYQQLLANGKTANVQVINVERLGKVTVDHNNAIYLSCELITANEITRFTAAAMAPKESIPLQNSIIPIFYNPDDLSIVVLL